MLRLEVTLSQAWLVSSSPPDGPEEITAAALTGEGLTARPRTRERGPARGVERGGSVWGREERKRVMEKRRGRVGGLSIQSWKTAPAEEKAIVSCVKGRGYIK